MLLNEQQLMITNNLFWKIKNDDAKAFEMLFNQLYPSMCVVAREYVKDDGVAEDIAQDAFIKLWNTRSKYNDITSIKSFLYVMVKNMSLNHLRRGKDGDKYTESLDEGDYQYFNNCIIEEETYRILQEAIEALPHQSANVMKLILQGMQNQEIAERLGISVNTVKTLKYNAMKTLKKTLKSYFLILLLILGEISFCIL